MNNEKVSSSKISRRSMLASSGAVVAVGAMAPTAFAAADHSKEIGSWKRMIGQSFSVQGSVFEKCKTQQLKMKLVSVEEMSAEDPNRPAGVRTPFTLLFVPENSTCLIGGGATYHVSNSEIGRSTLFIHETMHLDHSSKPILQSVFC